MNLCRRSALGVLLLFLSGCTLGVSSHQGGLTWTTVRSDPDGTLIHRVSPGVDLRLRGGDTGLTVGLSGRLRVHPTRSSPASPRLDLARWSWGRWVFPLGMRFERRDPARETIVGLVMISLPELPAGPRSPFFTADTILGVALDLTPFRRALTAGAERATVTRINPYDSRCWRVRYRSFAPSHAVLKEISC